MKDMQPNAGVIRDNYWDQVKGVLILLVVFGHVLEQCLNGRINTTTYSWIYTFHMPLFVFVSGYFTRIKDVRHYWNSLLNLFGQFAVFQLILTAPLLIGGGGIYELLIPKYILWYLWCLILWRMLYFVVDRYKLNLWVLLFISLICSVAVGYLPLVNEFSFQRTFVFFPYFVLGLIARNQKFVVKSDVSMAVFAIPMAIMIAAYIILFTVNHGVEWWLLGNNNYSSEKDMMYRVINYPIALIMGWSILKMCRLREFEFLVKAGKESMFILIYHAFIVRCVLEVAIKKFSIPTSFPCCILYTFAIVSVIWLLCKWEIFHKLLKPWTLFRK